jgi:hypothetical protein
MALSSTGLIDVRTGGNDLNGGFYNPFGTNPGTNWANQDAPLFIIDGTTISATVHTTSTQITIVGRAVLATDNRNSIRITGGTATAGVYEITAVDTVNNRYTLDRSAGTSGQTVQGRIGGALASIGAAAAIMVNGCDVWWQAGNYTCTTATNNVSGGTWNAAQVNTNENTANVRGYNTTYGDDAGSVVFTAAVSTTTLIQVNSGQNFEGITVDGAVGSQTAVRGFFVNGGRLHRSTARNCTNSGIVTSSTTDIEVSDCLVHGCTTLPAFVSGAARGLIDSVTSRDNQNHGFSGAGTYVRCRSIRNKTGGTWSGFHNVGTTSRFSECHSHDNSGDGFNVNNFVHTVSFKNTMASKNAGKGWLVLQTRADGIKLLHCAGFENGTGDYDNTRLIDTGANKTVYNFKALTVDPFINAAGDDFSLNNTPNGGAMLRDAGWPSSYRGLSTSNYPDIGGVQHQSAVGGGLLPTYKL